MAAQAQHRDIPDPSASGIVVLVLPKELVAALDRRAALKGLSRDELIARALRKELEDL